MDEFSEAISKFVFRPPSIPIVANVTARPLTDVNSIRAELSYQLRRCIQWQLSVEYMVQDGVDSFYEIGPGRVLSGLIKRINSEAQTFGISGVENITELGDSVVSD